MNDTSREKAILKLRYWMFGLLLLIPLFYLYAFTQQDNVKEAVVRHHFKSSSGAIFVAFNDHDPNNDFISRFNNAPVLVRKASQGLQRTNSPRERGAWHYFYVDTATGQRGSYINIGDVSWRGPFRAQVEVNYLPFGKRYTVARTTQGWVVVDEQRTWIN
jgi:hypothetical protein